MKAIRFVFCLFAALMLTTLNGLAAEEEDFKTFLQIRKYHFSIMPL